MLDVEGALYDLWEFRSIERSERYSEEKSEMEYLLIINKNAIATNYNDLEIIFDSIEKREDALKRIKQTFDDSDNVMIM